MRKSTAAIIAGVVIAIVVIAAVVYVFVLQKPVEEEYRLGILLPLTGTFADVAKTQREGVLLAIEEINAKGGLWGRVKVRGIVRDDEANLDVGVRRFNELLTVEKIHGIVGQTWVPMAKAINEQVKRNPMPYFPVCVVSLDMLNKTVIANWTFVAMMSAYSIGYASAAYAIQNLNLKKIYFLARSDSWGWDMYKGVQAAVAKFAGQGAEIVGYNEAPLGHADFSTILMDVINKNPDVFMFAQFGADQVNVLKQCKAMGIGTGTGAGANIKIFVCWITNVVAASIPPDALHENVYALHFHYWNLTGVPGIPTSVQQATAEFVQRYWDRWGYPPDSYAIVAYIATKELFRAVELAGKEKMTDAAAIAKALINNPNFDTPKGPARWRVDHEPVYTYAAFVVQGKPQNERTGYWDLLKVIGYYTGEEYLPPLSMLGYQ
ncbi:MAG: ABC transporter substrate-binding protein [Candidatus Bathyarchaeia archaeon]